MPKSSVMGVVILATMVDEDEEGVEVGEGEMETALRSCDAI